MIRAMECILKTKNSLDKLKAIAFDELVESSMRMELSVIKKLI